MEPSAASGISVGSGISLSISLLDETGNLVLDVRSLALRLNGKY